MTGRQCYYVVSDNSLSNLGNSSIVSKEDLLIFNVISMSLSTEVPSFIVSEEVWLATQRKRETKFLEYAGKNTNREKYASKYAFSGKLICEKCGATGLSDGRKFKDRAF